jgi:hypothetical protein
VGALTGIIGGFVKMIKGKLREVGNRSKIWENEIGKQVKQKREGDGHAMEQATTGANSQRTPSSLSPHLSPAVNLLRDANAGQSVLHKMCNCSWWEWTKGSTLVFWQWPAGDQQRAARDRMDPYLQSKPPSFQQRVKRPKQEAFKLLPPKFQAILARGYVVSNQDATEITELEDFIMSYIDYFRVDEVNDIRVLYNGASCGLNDTVWAPNF